MDILGSTLVIAAGAAPASPGQGGSPYQLPVMLIFMMAIFYIMLIRPQKRREKERRDMIANIKSGDRVVFSGGILGNVTNVKDKTFMIKVADNVKIEVSRGSVAQVLDKGEQPDANA